MSARSVPPQGTRRELPAAAPLATHDPAAIAASLERIRASVHRWLDRIEELARVRPVADPAGEFERGLLELEQERARLQTEAEERDRQWQARLDELEQDRCLLAEAWERLERERIEGRSLPRAATPEAGTSGAISPPLHPVRSVGEGEGPISQAILRQFETLRHDVRRRAETHQHHGNSR